MSYWKENYKLPSFYCFFNSICYSNIPITRYNVCYTHKSIIIVYTSMTHCEEEVLQHDFIYMTTLYVKHLVNLHVTNFINYIHISSTVDQKCSNFSHSITYNIMQRSSPALTDIDNNTK